jgi:hypothetical protein
MLLERHDGLRPGALGMNGSVRLTGKWALTSCDLASTLIERRDGERMTNLEEAREYIEGAVAVVGDADGAGAGAGAGAAHAAALALLGSVYLSRRRGNRADNAEAAWRYLSQARELAERLDLPPSTRVAMLHSLGNAAMARITGDHGQHVEDAITCYELGLELADPQEHAQLQAQLLSNLAAARAQRE